LDRNILTKLIELFTNGTLKDKYLLKVISSLMFWADFNGVTLTSGFALNEYANNKQNDINASRENNIFLKSFDYYSPALWLALATGKTDTIPKLNLSEEIKNYNFNRETDHFKMHYAEMLHIMCLFLQNELSIEKKIINFIKWNNENLLFCCYTIVYLSLLFSNKIKHFTASETNNIENALKKCKNQAWDLTYLSGWSTFYWNEKNGDAIYLFSTMDKDLKTVFINTHDVTSNIFIRFFGEIKGNIIQKEYEMIIKNRIKPEINIDILNSLVESEKNKLQELLS
jgi:hypothetical protein